MVIYKFCFKCVQNPVIIQRFIDTTPKRKYLATLHGFTSLTSLVEIPNWESSENTTEPHAMPTNEFVVDPKPMHIDEHGQQGVQIPAEDPYLGVDGIKSGIKKLSSKVGEGTSGLWKGVSDIQANLPCRKEVPINSDENMENLLGKGKNTNQEGDHSDNIQPSVGEHASVKSDLIPLGHVGHALNPSVPKPKILR